MRKFLVLITSLSSAIGSSFSDRWTANNEDSGPIDGSKSSDVDAAPWLNEFNGNQEPSLPIDGLTPFTANHVGSEPDIIFSSSNSADGSKPGSYVLGKLDDLDSGILTPGKASGSRDPGIFLQPSAIRWTCKDRQDPFCCIGVEIGGGIAQTGCDPCMSLFQINP